MLLPRSRVGACSPSTHRIASTTFDLPHPLGPTTAVIPGAKPIVVESRNDLKPSNSRLLRRMIPSPPPHQAPFGSLSQTTLRGSRLSTTYRISARHQPHQIVSQRHLRWPRRAGARLSPESAPCSSRR